MSTIWRRASRAGTVLVGLGAAAWALWGAPVRAGEWTTTAGDAQRTSWVRGDALLTKEAVQEGQFRFLWKMKLENESRQGNSLTEPILLEFLRTLCGLEGLILCLTCANAPIQTLKRNSTTSPSAMT